MKSVFFNLFLLSTLCLAVIAEDNRKDFRRSYSEKEIRERKNSFTEQVGIPLVFHKDSKPFTRTEISNKTTEKAMDDEDDDDYMNEDDKAEEMGSGYDKIEGMEPDDERGSGSGAPDLDGEFPPNADQIAKIAIKDVELTPDEIDKKMADQRKGYFQFTIKQPFKRDFRYKESSAYKILAGNVIKDVEKSLRARGVVKDVLFRGIKHVGGPPYDTKVEVYLKLKNVNPKRLEKLVNKGLINGMMTVPGSFQAKFI